MTVDLKNELKLTTMINLFLEYTMKHPAVRSALSALFGTSLSLSLASPAAAVTDEEFRELQQQLNILAEQVETNSQNATASDTTVGGYGELHYNNLGSSINKDKKELDFHRFVLFVNHRFNQNARFFSELEVEHAFLEDNNDGSGSTAPGSISIEQAYVQLDINDHSSFNAGIMLIPAGFINETHEPPTFYGVERNPISKYIIPTTWREAAVGLNGNFKTGISYDLLIHSGLGAGTDIRGGRQKAGNAQANNLASTARVKYTGIAGLELAATLQYQDDMTQDSSDDIGSATLIQAQARWAISSLTLTALYGQWNIDVADTAAAADRAKDIQKGGYLEASWRLSPAWGIFVRHNAWDNGGSGDTGKRQTDLGFNYWPHEDIVIKADYQLQNDIAGDYDGFNLGIGYQF